jgi:hypothetical protein
MQLGHLPSVNHQEREYFNDARATKTGSAEKENQTPAAWAFFIVAEQQPNGVEFQRRC